MNSATAVNAEIRRILSEALAWLPHNRHLTLSTKGNGGQRLYHDSFIAAATSPEHAFLVTK